MPNTRFISSRQAADVESYRRDESVTLPDDLDYAALPGLSNEVRHKLEMHRPRTVGHAGRIDGITPAALTSAVRPSSCCPIRISASATSRGYGQVSENCR